MKLCSYNVNGIRSAFKKDFIEWLQENQPEIVCIQELKAHEDQIDITKFEDLGYHVYIHAAEKKGYSGVAILSKMKPEQIVYGCGEDIYDKEGRIIRADFKNFSIMSLYVPSGSSGEERQSFKMEFLDFFISYIQDLKKTISPLIISGDYNICHNPIDIHNPVSNKNSSGFLPEERAWVSKFLDAGFIDTFRFFNKKPHIYSWWSFRFNARAKNLGWRIDYHMATHDLKDRLRNAEILQKVVHSDHCPVILEFD
jgi:exodeoxyribonuclease-3